MRDISRAWILFKRGEVHEALSLLQRCQTILDATDDFVARADVKSAVGRIMMRQGEYWPSLMNFDEAENFLTRVNPNHPHLARVRTNRGFVRFLVKRPGGISGLRPRGGVPIYTKVEDSDTARDALDDLGKARVAYSKSDLPHDRGLGMVDVHEALIRMRKGNLPDAERLATNALGRAEAQKDALLEARACGAIALIKMHWFQSASELAQLAEFGEQASLYADRSIASAENCGDERVLAAAQIWKAWSCLHHPEKRVQTAENLANIARSYLKNWEKDYLALELVDLAAAIRSAGKPQSLLERLAGGEVPPERLDKLLRAVGDEIIQRVYYQENENTSKTATRLSVGRNRVRTAVDTRRRH